MKKLFVGIALATFTFSATAQVQAPAPSPAAKIEQTVGLTDISIAYSRPQVKGRTVFGDLVPYGKMWRTGANKAVQFSASTDIMVEGKELKAGNYALFTVPNKDNWDIVFYEETEIWGTPREWVDSLEALRVNVKTMALNDNVESFTISIDNVVESKKAQVSISWATTKVMFNIETPMEKMALASIEKTMAGPSAGDYYSAASFYLETGKDLEQALVWIKKSSELREKEAYWVLRKQSLIEAKLGKTDDAIKTAKRSLELAEKAGNGDYVKMNKESIAEWSKK
jgi:hypothetical protein